MGRMLRTSQQIALEGLALSLATVAIGIHFTKA